MTPDPLLNFQRPFKRPRPELGTSTAFTLVLAICTILFASGSLSDGSMNDGISGVSAEKLEIEKTDLPTAKSLEVISYFTANADRHPRVS
jgi:hypothetical protein